MTQEERDKKLKDFLMEEDGMCVSAGGPPWREMGPAFGDKTRLLTLDLGHVALADRPALVAKVHALVYGAAVTPPSASAG